MTLLCVQPIQAVTLPSVTLTLLRRLKFAVSKYLFYLSVWWRKKCYDGTDRKREPFPIRNDSVYSVR